MHAITGKNPSSQNSRLPGGSSFAGIAEVAWNRSVETVTLLSLNAMIAKMISLLFVVVSSQYPM